MSTYYPQGAQQADIVAQGFVDGEFGWQFTLTIIPVGGEHKRTVYLSLTDQHGARHKHADNSINVLRHLGFHGAEADFARLDPGHPDCHSFAGQGVEAYCNHKTKDNGTAVEQWYINTPRAATAVKPLEKDMARKLNALFGKELKAGTSIAPSVPTPTPPTGITPAEAAAETETEDDVPF
jgi:hypothetical protein